MRWLTHTLHQCRVQLGDVSKITSENCHSTFARLQSFWETLQKAVENSQANFENTANDLDVVRTAFSNLVNNHLPLQLQALSQAALDLQGNVDSRLQQVEVQLKDIGKRSVECMGLCQMLSSKLHGIETANATTQNSIQGQLDQVNREIKILKRENVSLRKLLSQKKI